MEKKYGFLHKEHALANSVVVFDETDNKHEHFEDIPLPLNESCFHHGSHGRGGDIVRGVGWAIGPLFRPRFVKSSIIFAKMAVCNYLEQNQSRHKIKRCRSKSVPNQKFGTGYLVI
jgi:hypothetical protein